MKPIYYKAERFFPTKEYERNSKIRDRAEIVSYDILCNIICTHDLINDSEFFGEVSDLKILLQTPMKSNEQVIAYYKNPTESYENHTFDKRFEFCGYDLSEEMTRISAVTNCCGGFDKAIPYGELNKFGLIDDYNKAILIQKKLDELYPDECHACCEIYELWRTL